jgi:hypothetical protein
VYETSASGGKESSDKPTTPELQHKFRYFISIDMTLSSSTRASLNGAEYWLLKYDELKLHEKLYVSDTNQSNSSSVLRVDVHAMDVTS